MDCAWFSSATPTTITAFIPPEGEPGDSAAGLLADAGKPLPFLDRAEFYIYQETQPMWLNFLRGNLDRSAIPKDNYSQAITPQGSLREDLLRKGIRGHQMQELDISYICFNMEDSVFARDRKLRQAMQLAYDVETVIARFYNGLGMRAQSLVPPGLFGYDSTFRNPYCRFDPQAARKLLAEGGHPDGAGLPELSYLTVAGTDARQRGEHFAQNMAAVGVRVKVESCTWPEYLERLRRKKFQLVGSSWSADYPDPENFLQLLYGPNAPPGENNASYRNAEYDSLYRLMSVMADSPARLSIIQRMKSIAAEDCPWILISHRTTEVLAYDRVRNIKSHPILEAPLKYYRVD